MWLTQTEGPYTPVINPPKVERVKAITAGLIKSLTNLPFFGKSIKPISIPTKYGKPGAFPKGKPPKAVNVPTKYTAPKKPVSSVLGKPPKPVAIKVTGGASMDKARTQANKLTTALGKTDKADPTIKIKDNASTATSHIGKVSSALNKLDGKTSHVYIVTHKRTEGGYMGGPAMSAASFARGGKLPGSSPSDKTADNLAGFIGRTPIRLRSGEFIMNEPATKMFGPLLEAMNKAGNKSIGLAGGGLALPGRADGGSAAPIVNVDPSTLTDAQMRRLAELIGESIARRMRGADSKNIRLQALGAN